MGEKINPSVLKAFGIKDEKELEEFSRLEVEQQLAVLKRLGEKIPKESIWQKSFSLFHLSIVLNILLLVLIWVIKNLQ